jgi:DNA-binding transcriptional LysR family regulator
MANANFFGFDAYKASFMNLSWLDDFLTLAAIGSFSRAADERHMTQPAFSRRIMALEEWLGVDLFDRGSKPPVQHVFTAHLASVLRTMVLDNRGVAWLPATLVSEDIASGRLAVAASEDWRIKLEIRLYRDKTPLGPAGERFWEAVSSAI